MARLLFQVAGVIALALFLFLAWDFGQRVMLTWRLSQLEANVDAQVAQAQATHDALVDLKKRSTTDAFVEDKVRREKHYVRDGETIILTQITPAAPADGAAATATPTPNPWWVDLWNLLFGP